MFDVLLDQQMKEAFIDAQKNKDRGRDQFLSLRSYILSDTLISDVERLRRGDYYLSLPRLKEIPKDLIGEKRQIFIFNGNEQTLLRYMGFVLLRMYDHIFTDGLYSFRLHQTRTTQIEKIHEQLSDCEEHPYFAFKTDMKGYSTNIDQEILIRKLGDIFPHDPEFLNFLTWLIRRNKYRSKGRTVRQYMAALPGSPLTGFFTNVYLMDVDEYFQANCDFYCRFTDDVLVLCREDHKIFTLLIKLRDMARENKLELKKVKTELFSPNEPITIMGIRFEGPDMDISRTSTEKIKCRIRINAKAAVREIRQTGISHEEAARKFIAESLRPFMFAKNAKERNYAIQFFTFVTRDDTIREIDQHIQHCARYVLTEKWGKAQYRASYAKLKSLGYVSLVHLYHNSYKHV